jgi:predicted  nucleic acid-binding Zn-ribbon protein
MLLEELNLLISIQETDNKLKALDDEKGDLPEQLKRLSGLLDKASSEINDSKDELQSLDDERKRCEAILVETRERYEKSQATIYSVKTTREYDAISSEIELATDEISDREYRILVISEKKTGLEETLKNQESAYEELLGEQKERDSEMEERIKESGHIEDKLKIDRKKFVEKLKKPVYSHYERIRKIRDRTGVTHLVGDACSFCYSQVPPQRKTEIKKMTDMIICEVCGCILVSEEHSSRLDSIF